MKIVLFTLLSSLFFIGCEDANYSRGPKPECNPGFYKCGDICVDINTDQNNCGHCGNSCDGNSCEKGVCSTMCDNQALKNCSGSCVAIGIDNNNCGGCGIICPEKRFCSAGSCHCVVGLTLCDGECVNLQTDSNNCGKCSRMGGKCSETQQCVSGRCEKK